MNMTCKYIQGKMWLSVLTVTFYQTKQKVLFEMGTPLKIDLSKRTSCITVIFKNEVNVYSIENCPDHYDEFQFNYSGLTILIKDAIISYHRIDEYGRLVLELQAKEILVFK